MIGRRTVLAASAVASFAGLALLAVADSFWLFVASAVLRGVARALSSGPDEAWFVDTMHAVEGPDASLTRGLARGEAASSVGLGIGTLAGGALPLALGAVGPLPALAVPVADRRAGRAGPAAGDAVRHAGAAACRAPRSARSCAACRRRSPPGSGSACATACCPGCCWPRRGSVWRCPRSSCSRPGWLAGLVGDPERGATTYAVVAAAGFAANAVGSLLGPWAQRRLGSAVRAGRRRHRPRRGRSAGRRARRAGPARRGHRRPGRRGGLPAAVRRASA